jgi:hypothetical protein
VIADNKLALNAGWDLEMLKVEFDDLRVDGFDLDLTGFGAFEVADDILPATDRLFERLPDAQPWIVRIGYRAVDRFGARSLKNS